MKNYRWLERSIISLVFRVLVSENDGREGGSERLRWKEKGMKRRHRGREERERCGK